MVKRPLLERTSKTELCEISRGGGIGIWDFPLQFDMLTFWRLLFIVTSVIQLYNICHIHYY